MSKTIFGSDPAGAAFLPRQIVAIPASSSIRSPRFLTENPIIKRPTEHTGHRLIGCPLAEKVGRVHDDQLGIFSAVGLLQCDALPGNQLQGNLNQMFQLGKPCCIGVKAGSNQPAAASAGQLASLRITSRSGKGHAGGVGGIAVNADSHKALSDNRQTVITGGSLEDGLVFDEFHVLTLFDGSACTLHQ